MRTSANLKGKILQNETISTINLFTGANIKINEEGEVTDVCYALEVIKQEYADEQVAKEFVNSIDNMVISLDISVERACSILKHTVEDYNNAKELLKKETTA